MTVVPLDRIPPPLTGDDAPVAPRSATAGESEFAGALLGAFGDASAALARADGAERAFVAHRGGLQEMVVERARADVTLALASAAASRAAQSLATILGMQV
jgi:flagellar hook-basal body complex protein FliE